MTGKIRTRLRGRKMLRPPCPTCRRDRWKTLVKGASWMGRNCGAVRNAEPQRESEAA